ncbi:hypothetical protein TeGR_g6012, partial [Tetraparma gracilis]
LPPSLPPSLSRKDTAALSKLITKFAGVKAVAYHAGLKDSVRADAQTQWISGEAPICVATIAFGMGIDLACVRYVVHWNIPKNIEGFYQESGRAGRDGLPAESVTYFSKDVNCLEPGCRRCFLLKHFGERSSPAQTCKKTCDFCKDPDKVEALLKAASSAGGDAQANRGATTFGDVPKAKAQFDESAPGEYDQLASDDSDSAESDLENDDFGLNASLDDADVFHADDGEDSSPKERGRSAAEILQKYEIAEHKARGRKGKSGFTTFRKKGRRRKRGSESMGGATFTSMTPAMLGAKSQGVVVKKTNTFETVREESNPHAGKSSAQLAAEIAALKAKMAAAKPSLATKPLPKMKRPLPPPPKRL